LLRMRLYGAVDLRVGEIPTTGPTVAGGGQVEVAPDVYPAQRRGLGNRPATGTVDRQVLGRAPEVLGGVAVEPAGVDVDPVDGDVVGRPAQPGDRGIETDVGVDLVAARLEQERVPLAAELVALLLAEDGVQAALDDRGGHRRVEHE